VDWPFYSRPSGGGNLTERLRITSTGNVGIGTSSPWEALSIPFGEGLSFGSAAYPLTISRSPAGELVTTIADGYDSSSARIDFVMRQGAATENTALSITGLGNVGIGTVSPQSNLDVVGSRGIYQRHSSGGRLVFDDSDTADGSTPMSYISNTAGALQFGRANRSASTGLTTSSVESMRITSTGNVGIGTSSPAQKLHIENTSAGAYAQITSGTSSVAGVLLGDTLNNSIGRVSYDNADNSLQLWTSGAERLRIDSSGNVGIGVVPTQKLQVDGDIRIGDTAVGSGDNEQYNITTGGQLLIKANDGASDVSYTALTLASGSSGGAAASSSVITFEVNDTERMRIDSSGNLLVGTTDVNNNGDDGVRIKADGTLQVRSDNSGFVATLNRSNASNGAILTFAKSNTTVGSISSFNGDKIVIGTGAVGIGFSVGDGILPWNTTTNTPSDNSFGLGNPDYRFKDLYLSGGVYLGGTTSANLLDDYEEGTWTPTFVLGATGITYNTQFGKYIKIGSMVHCWFLISGSWTATADDMRVGPLPFTRAATNTWTAPGWLTGTGSSAPPGLTFVPSASTYVSGTRVDDTGSVKLDTSSSKNMEGSFSYSVY
jgi:hypothetical protein